MNLQQLTRKFEEAIGIDDFHLTNAQISEIFYKIDDLPMEGRTESAIQEIVTSVAGVDAFTINESIAHHNVNDIISQLEKALETGKS
ncbi:MAG: hypothetical protein Q8O72_05345 [Bacteroidales bacterium]|jgi:hypothetical protein|nr:hypothetical protein [Bacteroidales bacterium]